MKKLFLSLMLVAGLAAGFTSCENNDDENTTHTQTFTLGETSYTVDNAIAVMNIQYQDREVYNAIVLSQGELIGEAGGEGQAVVLLFKGNITSNTYSLSVNEEAYPKYIVARCGIDDIVNFDLENYEDNEDAYIAKTGTLTVEESNGKYVFTTDGIEVKNYKNDEVLASTLDYEGTPNVFTLATVEEGDLNGTPVVTAGTTKVTIMFIEVGVACFITENGDFIGFSSTDSFDNGIPTGEFTNSDKHILFVEAMNIENIKHATAGNITVAKDGDVYTIDINATIEDTDYVMHYVGTMPSFEYPF